MTEHRQQNRSQLSDDREQASARHRWTDQRVSDSLSDMHAATNQDDNAGRRWEKSIQQGRRLYAQARYAEAVTALQVAAEEARAFGADDPRVAQSLCWLARTHRRRGEFGLALRLSQLALGIGERQHAADSPDLSLMLNELGAVHASLGLYHKSEPLHQRALALSVRGLGNDHPDVADALTYLASHLRRRLDLEDARRYEAKALTIREQHFDAPDCRIAINLNGLGETARLAGDHAAAETRFEQALACLKKLQLEHHPDVATVLGNLALLHQTAGRIRQAEQLARHALAVNEQALGLEHPAIAHDLTSLASIVSALGDQRRAERMLSRALTIQQNVLNGDHPDMIATLNQLGEFARQHGRAREAEPLFLRALAIAKRTFGEGHARLGPILNNLGLTYYQLGETSEARDMLDQARRMLQDYYKHEHPIAQRVRANADALTAET